MTTQSEALKFGPQWIRKLSDCALPSQKASAKSPINRPREPASNLTDGIPGTKCAHSISEKHVKKINEEVDHVSSNVWNPLLASNFDVGDKKDTVLSRPTRTKDDNSKVAQSRGLQFCSPHTQLSCNNNNGFSSEASQFKQAQITEDTVLYWPPKTPSFPASDRNWRRRPVSVSTSTSIQQPTRMSPSGTKWKSSSLVPQSVADDKGNPSLNTSIVHALHAPEAPESSDARASGDILINGAEAEASHQPTNLVQSTSNETSSQESEVDVQSPKQDESSFAIPVSKGLGTPQAKRAASAYYGIQSASQKRSPEADSVTNALWEQQQLWSKSVPHQLHGLERGTNDVISTTLASILGQQLNVNASIVRDTDRFESFDGPINPSTVTEPSSFQLGATRGVSTSEVYSALDESRGFHRPDGADCPDEHMWLYEDPQGRTQGTFSDAQMHEWLLAGIYFTPTLRIRRKCDDTFSTLADYTRLFGRVPFLPNFRIPSIRGGITPQLLSLVAAKSGHPLPTGPSPTSETPHSAGPVGSGTSSGVSTVGLPLPTAFHLSTSTTMNFTGSLESATASNVGRSPISSISSHRPVFAQRTDSSEYTGQIGAVHMVPSSSIGDTCNTAQLKTTGGMCANSSLPVLQNRNSNAPMSLITRSLGGMNLTSGLNTTENDSPLNSSSNHPQPVTADSTLMTLASLISMSPALASLALPFAGHSVTASNATTDFAAAAAAAISPGFLTALAQYLNVQPHATGHQSVSPMQQLAETAQLAAQLAAMVGAHSPDQTPMQPAQALALAQLVISQATSSLPEQPWTSLTKREVTPTDHAQDPSVHSDLNRRVDRPTSDELMRARMHLASDPAGLIAAGDKSCLDSQSSWSVGFGITDTNNRISPRAVEGRALGANAPDSLVQTIDESERIPEGTTRSGGSGSTAFSTPKSQTKGQSKSGSQRSPISMTAHKTPSGFSSGATRDAVGSSGDTEGTVHHNTPKNNMTVTNLGWSWSVGSDVADGKRKSGQVLSGERDAGRKPSPSTKQPANQWVNKTKSVPQAENGTVLSPPKCAGATSSNKSKVIHGCHSVGSTTKPQATSSRETNLVVADAEAAADQELEQLIQWCQSRLSSLPMREKVDIPTVVELLATLDAPYEVERMVQTFLGESARTSQFVKDFLDRRRPFWQLHRERRERESQVKSGSKSQASGNHAQSSGPRSNEKKKKMHTREGAGRTNSTTGCSDAVGWHKMGNSTSVSHTDPTQDNEWHHIKPKGSHNRRGKKDKTS